jgi:photosystem II stability/assembly factor-like uncharacterized protein
MQIRSGWSIFLVWVLASCSVPVPNPVSPWSKVDLPTDRPLLAIRAEGNTVTAVDDRGRVLSSKEGFTSPWEIAVQPVPGVDSFPAIHLLENRHVWAAQGYFTDEDVQPLAIYEAVDRHWKKVLFQPSHDLRVAQLHFFNEQNGVLFAWHSSRWGGCLRTADGGKTWKELDWPVSKGFALDRQHIWGIGRLAILRSQDAGRSWEAVLSAKLPSDLEIEFEGLFFINKDCGWAYGSLPMKEGGQAPFVASTRDGGSSWLTLRVAASASAGDHLVVKHVLAVNPDTLWLALQRVTFGHGSTGDITHLIVGSADGGKTWSTEWSAEGPLGKAAVTMDGMLVVSGGTGSLLYRRSR